ncbi:MAG: hypothetical protein LUF33_07460 [Clostridiales bacterium]|nr:hypothetical protein [Clostridiales bacterium]
MNFKTTLELLEVLDPFIENANITVSDRSKNIKNKNLKSDYVMIDRKNNIGFEVFDNEISVFYFTEHCHFDDYASELIEGEDDYIKRAKDFLFELLQNQIRHMEIFKGESLHSEKYYIVYCDGREDKYIGGTWFGLVRLINPFLQKIQKITTWQYDKSKGYFTNRQPKIINPEAIEVIDVNEYCYIEIIENHNSYIYNNMDRYFDDYFGMYYWSSAFNIIPSGFYDTKYNAVQSAMEALKSRKFD